MKVLYIQRTLPQEPIGPMYLSRAVKDAGHEMEALFVPDPQWLKRIAEYEPDVIAWSVMTGNHAPIYDLNKLLKTKFDFLSIMGGPHVTFVPDCVTDPNIDALCMGEGEGAIVELLDALRDGRDWREVPNIAYCDDGETVVKNPLRPLVKDLDSLGIPDRSVIYDAQSIYRDSGRKVIVTQRGCPMLCSFCFHHAWKKKVYGARNNEYVRKRSVDHVIAEANSIREQYPLDFVHFLDDIFNIDSKWLTEFCERWPKEVGLPFDVILMANMTKEVHIEQLKAAGCIYARIAFEAANDYIRNTIYRKNTGRQQLVDSAGWIKKHGIRLGSLNMLGAPGGTLEDDFETIRLNIECEVDHPLCSIVQPYPEFELNEITEGLGIAVADYEDFPANFNREATIFVDDKQAIENLHKWFPILVRFPWLMPVAKKTLRFRGFRYPLLWSYMLFSEWLVTEQNRLYNRARGKRGMAQWTWVDFSVRVVKKGVVRVAGMVGAKVVHRMATRLQMGDERVVAHMD